MLAYPMPWRRDVQSASIPGDEDRRLASLQALNVLDSPPEAEFDALVQAASLVCEVPISLISLVDHDRQWFKANHGLAGATETPREVAFCSHAILGDDVFEVPDALADQRFNDNPLVSGAPDIRFYAGAPLILSDGAHIGTLCVIDRQARQLSERQRAILAQLGTAAAKALEGRRALLLEQEMLAAKLRARDELEHLKSEFLAAAAHELRTPMTSIYGFAELLIQRDMPAEKQRRYLDTIHRQCASMMELTSELLELSHLESRRGRDFNKQAVALDQLTAEVLGDFKLPAGRQPADLQIDPAGHWTVQGDRQKLRQALLNLVSNAYKYSPDGGPVTVRLQCDAEARQIQMVVQDRGVGIPADKMGRLTERFYRADPSGKIPGTGLGLSIVKEIAQLHGGSLQMDSVAGVGTTATISLPMA